MRGLKNTTHFYANRASSFNPSGSLVSEWLKRIETQGKSNSCPFPRGLGGYGYCFTLATVSTAEPSGHKALLRPCSGPLHKKVFGLQNRALHLQLATACLFSNATDLCHSAVSLVAMTINDSRPLSAGRSSKQIVGPRLRPRSKECVLPHRWGSFHPTSHGNTKRSERESTHTRRE